MEHTKPLSTDLVIETYGNYKLTIINEPSLVNGFYTLIFNAVTMYNGQLAKVIKPLRILADTKIKRWPIQGDIMDILMVYARNKKGNEFLIASEWSFVNESEPINDREPDAPSYE